MSSRPRSNRAGFPVSPRWRWWLVLALLAAACTRRETGAVGASGRIEITEVTLSSKVGGRVVALLVGEGEEVKAGQVLVRLEGDEIEALLRQATAAGERASARVAQAQAALRAEPLTLAKQVEQAEAGVRASEERLALLRSGPRVEEVREARAAVDQAQARVSNARTMARRYRELYAKGLIARQDLDGLETEVSVLDGQLRASRERLAALESGSRPEEIRAAEAEVERARATLALARANEVRLELMARDLEMARATLRESLATVERLKTQVRELSISSPLSGTVLTKVVEVGEVVEPRKPIFTVGDLDHPWIKIYVTETELGKVRLGQPAKVTVDSFPNRAFSGNVTWIASESEFTPKNIQTKEERVNLVYAVKIQIDNAQRLLKAGMPADATLLP